jgi:hypothetical protein
MSQGIILYGSDDVSRAGNNMQAAANDMLRAANTMEECTRRLEFLFSQSCGSNLDRLIEALERNAPPIEK